MKDRIRLLDEARRAANDTQNHVIDEFLTGHIHRRGLLRYGSIFGLSPAVMGGLISAFAPIAAPRARATGKPGATIRVAMTGPTGAINPVTVAESGGLLMLQQTGEFLIMDGPGPASEALACDFLVRQSGWHRLDVQAAKWRKISLRQRDDGGRRRLFPC